jgi:F-type H+-transporting ATPase subunit alpha
LNSYDLSFRLSISLSRYFTFHNPLKRGVRIALRAKVNDSIITGIRVLDSILPVGRGQRQLILGDRYTGKTSTSSYSTIFLNSISSLSINGCGTKRLFGLYIGINQNPSKLSKLIFYLLYCS